MREALALLIPACAIGVFVCPRPVRPGRASVCAAALSLCLGIGFSSLVSLAFVVMGIAPATTAFVVADVVIWTSVAVLAWRMRSAAWTQEPDRRRQDPASGRRESGIGWTAIDWILRVAFGVTTLIALASVIASLRAAPHGDWDAWAIWNQHARFLFRGGGSDVWRGFLEIGWSQPDYPLLLPAAVARVWAYAGHDSTLGPALVAMAFGIASVTLVVTALDGRRAWIAGTLMLGATTFLTQVPSLCADVPLACYIVATLAVACGDGRQLGQSSPQITALLAGATSAMAAWTKNEGIVFALLMLIVAAVVVARSGDGDVGARARGRRWRLLLWGIAGGAPVFIALVWFKLALAPPSVLAEGLSLDVFATRALDLNRHATVAALMAQHAVRWSAPFAVAVFPIVSIAAMWMAVRGGPAVRMMAAVAGLMLGSYYLAYVISPFDIAWHVSTSIDRLLVQLWPLLVLTAFGGRGDSHTS
jgi:hypothetical protein